MLSLEDLALHQEGYLQQEDFHLYLNRIQKQAVELAKGGKRREVLNDRRRRLQEAFL
jgi:hypothetical protein